MYHHAKHKSLIRPISRLAEPTTSFLVWSDCYKQKPFQQSQQPPDLSPKYDEMIIPQTWNQVWKKLVSPRQPNEQRPAGASTKCSKDNCNMVWNEFLSTTSHKPVSLFENLTTLLYCKSDLNWFLPNKIDHQEDQFLVWCHSSRLPWRTGKKVFFRGVIVEKAEVSTYLSHGTLGNGFSTTIPQQTTGSQKTPRTKLVGGLNPFEKY